MKKSVAHHGGDSSLYTEWEIMINWSAGKSDSAKDVASAET